MKVKDWLRAISAWLRSGPWVLAIRNCGLAAELRDLEAGREIDAKKIDELRAAIEQLDQERDLAANSAKGWMERAKQLEEQLRLAQGLAAPDARVAVLAEHAGRAAMLSGRVLRYGWDQRRELDASSLREQLAREISSLIAISKQVSELCSPRAEG